MTRLSYSRPCTLSIPYRLSAFNHHNAHMSNGLKSILSSAFLLILPLTGLCAQQPADSQAGRQDFMAAMQRIQQRLPDTKDSPALESYAIYDYLVAARLKRDLDRSANEDLDAKIDVFLQSHAGQPV